MTDPCPTCNQHTPPPPPKGMTYMKLLLPVSEAVKDRNDPEIMGAAASAAMEAIHAYDKEHNPT